MPLDRHGYYDKPRIDKSKLRICGPFSVEAVPAPTVLSLDESMPARQADETVARSGETSRQALWRDELLKTGVRGKGGAMLRFAEFETLPGLKHIHASGSLAETGERVVVSFGPEHAALEQRQVELALTEAETLRPSPKFILFCAFTFDPEAAKDIDEVNWPGVTLLKAQMNTDLLTEDLKKKRASNQSFWLMGQPDVELRKRKDGMWEVEVNGFDYFDPKAGDLVSGGKKQIAMWSLDVDYDNRSLMPHQVFFPMADAKGGWNRLRRTVRAELDEDLLEQFHGTVSLPFEAGENRAHRGQDRGRPRDRVAQDHAARGIGPCPSSSTRHSSAPRSIGSRARAASWRSSPSGGLRAMRSSTPATTPSAPRCWIW
jgi:adenine-specific DNA-methyltransferase